jgi:hypothetical protein
LLPSRDRAFAASEIATAEIATPPIAAKASRRERPAWLHLAQLWFKLNVRAASFCEILSFPEFTFSLEPKLFIPPGWPAIFLPDFPGAISDFSFLRLRQSAGSLFQFVSQGQYAADRFVVADPLRELAILVGRREKMVDDLLRIHGKLHLK